MLPLPTLRLPREGAPTVLPLPMPPMLPTPHAPPMRGPSSDVPALRWRLR